MRGPSWSLPEAALGVTSTRLLHSQTSSFGNVRTCVRSSSAHAEGSRLGSFPNGRWNIGSFPCAASGVGSGGRTLEFLSLSRAQLRPQSGFTVGSVRSWWW